MNNPGALGDREKALENEYIYKKEAEKLKALKASLEAQKKAASKDDNNNKS